VNHTPRYAPYLWLAPVGALLVLAAVLSRHPDETRFRDTVIRLFEQAQRVELHPAHQERPVVTISRDDRRQFRALLHGVRSSYVAPLCPAAPDTLIDIYLPPSGAARPEPEMLHAYYHTTCGQITFADYDAPKDRALRMGPAFRYLVPKPAEPSQCPPEPR